MVRGPILTLALSLSVLGAFACGAASEEASGSTPTAQPEMLAPTAAATATGAGDDDISASYQRDSRFVPLDNPDFIAADEAGFLDAEDLVLGLTIAGESRAYPISMMTYHHIVNDTIGGRPILITF